MTPDQDKQIQDAAAKYWANEKANHMPSAIQDAFLAGAKFAQARIDQLEGALKLVLETHKRLGKDQSDELRRTEIISRIEKALSKAPDTGREE